MYEPYNSGDENSATRISFDQYQFWRTTYSSAITAGRYEEDDVIARLKRELSLDDNGFPDDASRLPSFRQKIPLYFTEGWWESFVCNFQTWDTEGKTLTIKMRLPNEAAYDVTIALPKISIGGPQVYPGALGSFGHDITPGTIYFSPDYAAPTFEPSEYPSLYSEVTAARYFAFMRYPRRIINPHIF